MSQAIGLRQVQVLDETRGIPIPTLVLYPAEAGATETEEHLGPFTLRVARDAAPVSARALVVISHGSGGSPATHRELARFLATQGFVVAVPEHPGNSRTDDTRADTVELLADRPRDLRAVADWVLGRDGASPFAARLEHRAYAIVGHSLGAYTGLALAGGVPTSLPHQHADRVARRIDVEPDPRVAGLVLLAPAVPWFRLRGSLAAVRVPILMIASYADEAAPYFVMCPIVEDNVADRAGVEIRLVEGASHYGFLSPWPELLRDAAIPPSLDPPGFDRVAFHAWLYPEIVAFVGRLVAAANTRA
jgi:predicted dienelactone hydrolase